MKRGEGNGGGNKGKGACRRGSQTLSGVSCSLIICLSVKMQRLCTISKVFWPLQTEQTLGSVERKKKGKGALRLSTPSSPATFFFLPL